MGGVLARWRLAPTRSHPEGAPVRVFLAPSSVFPLPEDPAGHPGARPGAHADFPARGLHEAPDPPDADPDPPDETRDFSDDGSERGSDIEFEGS